MLNNEQKPPLRQTDVSGRYGSKLNEFDLLKLDVESNYLIKKYRRGLNLETPNNRIDTGDLRCIVAALHIMGFEVVKRIYNLSRAQAQNEFLNGSKISHQLFLNNEFVYLNDKKQMVDEFGNILNKQDFWLSRGGEQFNDGWFVV